MNEKLLTAEELAKELRVSKQTIYTWQQEGMPVVVPRPMRAELVKVKEWLNRRGK